MGLRYRECPKRLWWIHGARRLCRDARGRKRRTGLCGHWGRTEPLRHIGRGGSSGLPQAGASSLGGWRLRHCSAQARPPFSLYLTSWSSMPFRRFSAWRGKCRSTSLFACQPNTVVGARKSGSYWRFGVLALMPRGPVGQVPDRGMCHLILRGASTVRGAAGRPLGQSTS